MILIFTLIVALVFFCVLFFIKKGQVLTSFFWFQLNLYLALISVSITNFETGFFAKPFVDYNALLFYVIILIVPITFYNFTSHYFSKPKATHKKPFLIPIALFGVNTISFFYLTFNNALDNELYELIETLMNTANFISFLFLFPIITSFYIVKSVLFLYHQLSTSQGRIKSLTTISVLTLLVIYTVFIVVFFTNQWFDFSNRQIIYTTLISLLLIASTMVFLMLFKEKENTSFSGDIDESHLRYAKIKANLENYMEVDANYKNPSLSLKNCAKAIGTNEKYLSNYLNNVQKINFSTYLNNLRIAEAKRLLKSEEAELYTIETISKMAGFNSKSSFNAVFKTTVGMTPSEYRNSS